MIIYCIRNKISNKCYIGQTVQPLKCRIACHLSNKGCRAIDSALSKYGIENFDISTIATAKSMDELNALEERYILEYNSMYPNGYNLTTGGGSRRFSEETKRKLSLSHIGVNVGRIPSEESLKRMSIAQKKSWHERKNTEEWRRKVAEKNREKEASKEARKKLLLTREKVSYSCSEETRRKTSNTMKEVWRERKNNSIVIFTAHSEETKQRLRDISKKQWETRDRVVPEERRIRIGNSIRKHYAELREREAI